jgi:hypothetical protein
MLCHRIIFKVVKVQLGEAHHLSMLREAGSVIQPHISADSYSPVSSVYRSLDSWDFCI